MASRKRLGAEEASSERGSAGAAGGPDCQAATALLCRALALACTALAALVAGCRPGPEAPVVVDFWAMGREAEVVERLVPRFEAGAPGIRVRVQRIPWSAAHEKLITAYVGGTLPDAFQLGNTWVAELVAIGAIEPLDERLAASRSLDGADFFPGILDASVVDGRLWAIPWYVDTRLLFYRTDLLERVGAGPPRTWQEWVETMVAVQRRAGTGAHAILLPLTEWQTPVILAMQRGAHLLRDGDLRGDFQSPQFREAFDLYLDLFRRGLAPRGGEAQAASLYQGFAEGLFSFVVSGPWSLGELRERLPASLADSWSTAPMPAPDGEFPGVSLAGGASLAVARDSARQDAAWRWIEYLGATEQQVAFHAASGDLPARRSAWREGAIAEESRTRAFRVQLDRVRATPKVPEWERIAARIGQHAEAAIRGDESLEQALAALDREVDAILEKRRWLHARSAALGASSTAAADSVPPARCAEADGEAARAGGGWVASDDGRAAFGGTSAVPGHAGAALGPAAARSAR